MVKTKKRVLSIIIIVSLLLGLNMVGGASAASGIVKDTEVPPMDGYKLVWHDEFDGTALNTTDWKYEFGFVRNHEPQFYTRDPKNVFVADGNLNLVAMRESTGTYTDNISNPSSPVTYTTGFTSGSIYTSKFFQYGRWEARMNFPPDYGLWPAFWTLGQKGGWPGCGEIDMVEYLARYPRRDYITFHYTDANGGANYISPDYYYNATPLCNTWHTYGMNWTETKIDFLFDGNVIGTVDITDPSMYPDAHQPHKIIIDLAMGNAGSWADAVKSTFTQATFLVDWVRVWQVDDTATTAATTTTTSSEQFPYKLNNGYLSGINLSNNSVSGFKSECSAKGYTAVVYDKNDQEMTDGTVGTGCSVSISQGSTSLGKYTVIVYGDISGDGLINAYDLLKCKQHLLNISRVTGAPLIAGNVDRSSDSAIDTMDLLSIKNDLLKIKSISQN